MCHETVRWISRCGLRCGLLLWVVLGPCNPAASAQQADDAYNYIAGLFERGHHELVATEAAKFLRDHPDHPRIDRVRYRLGQSLFEQKDYEASRQAFATLAGNPGFEFSAECELRLGQCALSLDHKDEAAAIFRQLSDRLQDSDHYLAGPAAFFAAEAAFQGGDFLRASGYYARTLKHPDAEEYQRGALYGLAWSCYRQGELEVAEQSFEMFLRRYPDDPACGEAQFLLGECLLHQGLTAPALEAFQKVPEGEYLDDALSAAGFAAAKLEQHRAAAQFFLRLERTRPRSELVPEARLHAGIQLFREKEFGDAAAVLDRLLESTSAHLPEAAYWRGMVERELRGPDAAIPYFDAGLRGEPTAELRQRLQMARSDALFDAGRFEEASQQYQDVDSDVALYSAAVAALNGGDAALAVAKARELLRRFGESELQAPAHLIEGEGLFQQGDFEDARRSFEAVAKATPSRAPGEERPRALSRVGWCLFLLDKHPESAAAFGRFLGEYPTHELAAEASALRGRALLRAGAVPEARKALQQYRERHAGGDHDDDVAYDLAQCERILGQDDAARSLLGELLSRPDVDGALALRSRFDQAELLSAQQEYAGARPLYQAVAAGEDPALARLGRYGLAWCCYSLEDAGAAASALQQLLDDPDLGRDLAAPSLELLSSVLRMQGRGEAAAAAYGELVKLDPEFPRLGDVALVAGLALKEQGKLAEAAALLDDADRRFPAFAGRDQVVFELAFLQKELQQTDAHRATLARFQRDFPDSKRTAEAAFHRGESLFESGDYAAARAAYEPARQGSASLEDLALYKTGWCWFYEGDFEAAARNFAAVADEHPASPVAGESRYLAGESLVRTERFAEAQPHLVAFLQQYGEHESRPQAMFRLGQCARELGDPEACLEVLTRLAREQPEFEQRLQVDLWRGESLLRLGRIKDARRLFQQVADQDRGELAARAHLGLGHCLRDEDRLDQALGEYLKVVLLFESPTEVAEALLAAGNCLEQSGDVTRAAAQYRELLRRFPDTALASSARQLLEQLKAP